MDIRYLPAAEIDKVKWNSCVHYAPNGNVCGYKWYLDATAREWDGLVEGDYESVLPLPRRKDWTGRKEVFIPVLMREAGIYSINVLSRERITAFLAAVPKEYGKVQIELNAPTKLPPETSFTAREKIDYLLALDRPYEELAGEFSRNLLLTLEKAEQTGLKPVANLKPEKVAAFYKKHAPAHPEKERIFHAAQRIMYNVLHRGWGFAAGVQSSEGDLLAADFYIYSHTRVLRLLPVVSAVGKRVGALEYLTNTLLRTHAGKQLVLDFNTEKREEFAPKFGAIEQPYQVIKRDNRLLKIG